MEKTDESAGIDVLREMVRLAENRRAEALSALEKMNKYNLAIVAFAGSFLSLLVTVPMSIVIIRSAGLSLITSIIFAIWSIRPHRLRGGGALDIGDDVVALKHNQTLKIKQYLLDTAEFTNISANALQSYANNKRKWTIIAAVFLAFSLLITYILAAYA